MEARQRTEHRPLADGRDGLLSSTGDTLSRPLEGVKVVAFEQAIAMPFCSFMLAEMGADVIKIERTGTGDVLRGWDDAVRGLSTGYVWVNAGKRDITIDARQADGRDIVRKLAAEADVFLENFAPGVTERLGIADADLRPDNERLIYCSLSAYGQDGPYRDVKAYDLLIQGESGILLSNGYPDAPAKVGLPVTDLIGGSNAAMGVMLALLQRERTGRGVYLDVAMLDSVIPWLGYFPQHHWHTGAEPPRSGMRHQYLSPYGPYLAGDDHYVNLVVAGPDDWRRFCELVAQKPEWLTDPRFASIEARRSNRDDLEQHVEALIASAPSDVWLGRLAEAGLPYGRVRGMAEVLSHPQLLERRMFVEADSPVGRLPLVRFPLAEADQERHLPDLGEHTDEILGDLGYSGADVAGLHERGVV